MVPKKVSTPGSYVLSQKKTKKPPKKKVGRPGSAQKKKKARRVKHRENYSEADILEAVRLVREENFSIAGAAQHVSEAKPNTVPRMTLSDRLKKPVPDNKPLGRPQELSPAAEEALIKCVEMCAEFNYPMRKRELQVGTYFLP
jgi:hypothetical protein